MTNITKKLLTESSIYSLGPLFEKLIGLFLIPIYTAYLTPADYGMLQYIITIGAFLVPVIGAGLTTAFWRFRSEDQWDNGEVCLHVVAGQLVIGAFIIACMTLIHLGAYNTVVGFLLIVYVASRVLMTIYESTLLILQARHRIFFYLVLSISYAAALAGTSVFLIVILKLNYFGVIYSAFWVTLTFAVLFSWPLIKEIKWRLNLPLLKQLLKYGIPLAYANIAAMVIIFSDVIFLKWLSSDHEVGLYSFGYKFAMLVDVFLVSTFFKSWNPMRWEIYKRDDSKIIFSAIYDGLLVFFPALALLVTAMGVLLAGLLTKGPEYLPGLMIVPVIGAAYVFYAIFYFNAMGLLFSGRTNYILRIMLASAGLNTLLNILLIPKYGMYGASVATLLSYICMAFLSIIVSQRLYEIPRNRLLETGQLLILPIIAFSIMKMPDDLSVHSLNLFYVLVAAAVVMLISGLVFNPKTFHEVKNAVVKVRSR